MFNKSRLCVPSWVLLITLIAAASFSSVLSSPQLGSTAPQLSHFIVIRVFHALPDEPCTVLKQSCVLDVKKMPLSNEQKKVVKSIFKNGDKVINEECHKERKIKVLVLFSNAKLYAN